MSRAKSDIDAVRNSIMGLDKSRTLIKLIVEVYRKQLAEISPSVPVTKLGRLPFYLDKIGAYLKRDSIGRLLINLS